MFIGAAAEEVGLTERGVRLFWDIRAAFLELAVPVGPRDVEDPELMTSEGALRGVVRRWEALWRRHGVERDPLYDEIVGELADRPRTPADVARRLVKKRAVKSLREVERAVRELTQAGVLTREPGEIYVADR